ncbi:MAG: SufE family protein [Alphaproteobacteria bacterium]
MADIQKSDIQSTQQEIIDELGFFEDWADKYRYIIDQGRKLPSFPEAWKVEENKVKGCQSQVWLKVEDLPSGHLKLHAISDAAIVSGLIAIILRIYDERTPQEILTTSPDFIKATGLDSHLSPTRNTGLAAMLRTIAAHAEHRRAA